MYEMSGKGVHKCSQFDNDACSSGKCRFVCDTFGELKGGQTLEGITETLLDCRGFLWDVLLDGKWTGCSGPLIKKLKVKYGAKALLAVFD